ncbi:MAG: efflux RND transporter permease subunit, partial [Acidobacteria bacterium]|nr:efflux RND transporter permease subunit [Acidobacteriota bacterium]
MRSLAAICIKRPVFATMIVAALVVVGGASFFRLGTDRFPAVDLPTIMVHTVLPGASVEEMETQVSEVIEEAVNRVEGITELRSISGPGQSRVIVTFDLRRDIDTAAQDVRDRVASVLRQLPDDAEPPIIQKQNSEQSPTLSVALSGDLSIRELTEIADKVVKVVLERSTGVGEVQIVGGLERAVNIWVEADRLAAYQLSIAEVRSALQQQNADVPGGNVTTDVQEQTLRTMGRFTEPSQFGDLVVATRNAQPIRVRDIGYAEDGTKEQRSIARLNGVPAVVLEVRRQSGANTVEMVNDAKATLERVRPQIPAGVRMEVVRDQSTHIHASLHEINVHLVLGSILACLVVFAFMRDWRATIIAAVAIPTSVVSTFGLMAALGFTLNTVTMLALVLMVGIVIDDAIVVLENIFRFIEEKDMDGFTAAREATAEIALPVLATTLCLVVIFIPVSFMSSISGRFLYQFGLTAACAIMVSLLVSFTLTPMMSARMFNRRRDGAHGHEAASRQGLYGRVDALYAWTLAGALRRRGVVAAVAIGVILLNVVLYRMVRQEFIPGGVDEAQFEMNVAAPEGASPAAMSEVMAAIDKDVRSVPGVRLVVSTLGGGPLGAVNEGQLFVQIAPHDERMFSLSRLAAGIVRLDPLEAFRNNYSQRDVMQQIRGKVRKYRDLRVAVRNLQTFNIGGGNFDLDFIIRGPELEALSRFTETLRDQSADLGLQDADTTLKLNKPELRVEIDRARAADLGIRTQDIAAALRLMVGGDQEVSRFRDASAGEDYDVQLRLVDADRRDPETISRLYVARNTGEMVRMDSVVRLEEGRSPSRVDRFDRQRQANLRSGIAAGYGLADRIEAVRAAAARLNMPAAYTTAISGRGRELERTFTEFGWAFILSVIFMYMVLAAQYESLVNPLVILLALPLSLPFALLSIYLTQDTLNLYSALGMLVLFGVVAKNSILQIDHTLNLRRQGRPREQAILDANRDRLRPILMTTLALVGGMLPLAIGTGPGAEERRTIAVVVIGGQLLSLFLTLVVIPVAYSLMDDAVVWVTSRRRRSAEEPAEV